MIKLIAVFTVAIGLLAAAFASAATMTVTGGAVQAGSDSDLVCQTDTLMVDSWQIFGIGDTGAYVETVTVKGMNSGCVGNRLMLGVTSGGHVYHSVNAIGGLADPSGSYFHTIAPGDIGNTIQFYLAQEGGPAGLSKLNPADITGIEFIIEGSKP